MASVCADPNFGGVKRVVVFVGVNNDAASHLDVLAVAAVSPFTNLVSPSNSTVVTAPLRVFTEREWSVIVVTVPMT